MAKKKSTDADADTPAPANPGYTVLARRYRPQQFRDLVGQEAVAQALINALQSNRVAHAYLFTGARGVGKTSAARILAKALNCVKGPTPTPCDQCEICQAIMSGEDTDTIEIDGASNNGVENVRELRANVQFRPSRSRYKIYIIDEVHMLSTPAFNALLKTLEEPPPHVKFIFATTEVQKVPVTILSRCQRFDFGGISIPRILTRLREIVAAEKMESDDEALEMVARRAGGSMRDAQSLLDQLLAFSGKKLTADSVNELLGTANEERIIDIASAVFARDAKKVLEILGAIVDQGQQLGELLEQLIEYWRDVMIVNTAGLAGQSVSVSSARRPILEQHAKAANLDTILAGMDILVTAKQRMRSSSHARAILELALVRMCRLDELVPIVQLAQWIGKDGGASPGKPPSPPAALARPAVGGEAEKKKPAAPEPAQAVQLTMALTAESLPQIWQQVLAKSGFALQAELRKVKSTAIFGPNTLVLSVSRRYNATGSFFLDSVRLGKLQEIVTGIVGQPCALRIDWIDEPAGAAAPGTRNASAQAMGQQRAEWMQIPLVKKAADVLGAQIMRADDGFGAPAPQATDSEPVDTPELPAAPEED